MNNIKMMLLACVLGVAAETAVADVSALFRGRGGVDGGGGERGAGRGAAILSLDSAADEGGFRYAYRTSNGIDAQQQGRRSAGATPETGGVAVDGTYSYVGTDGHTYSVSYTADENGYRAQGAHLPTPPPIPDAILESLRLTAPNSAFGSRNSFGASPPRH